METKTRVYRLLALLLCFCMAMTSFSTVFAEGGSKADLYNPDQNANISSYYGGDETDQVTLLAGNSAKNGGNEVRGKTVLETIQNYRNTYMLGVASDFCVFLEDDFWVTQSDAEGRVAVGGNIYADLPWDLNYVIGAGDYYWHTPLDELLVDENQQSNRLGAATVILGGYLYGSLHDTYYAYPPATSLGFRSKFEGQYQVNGQDAATDNHGELLVVPTEKTSKKLVINKNSLTSDDIKAYFDTQYTPSNIPEFTSYWSSLTGRKTDSPVIPSSSLGNYQSIDQKQTYVTQLLDFSDSFNYLRSASQNLATAKTEFTVEFREDNTHYGYPESNKDNRQNNGTTKTLVLTYVGDQPEQDDEEGIRLTADEEGETAKRDCVYLTLTSEQFAMFTEATFIEFENIPELPETRFIVDISDTLSSPRDNVHLVPWNYAFILINVLDKGDLHLTNLDRSSGQKYTTINGRYISRYGDNDNKNDSLYDAASQRNNHAGVTSLLYNFPNADKIILGNNFQGTILAPDALVTDEFTEREYGGNGYDNVNSRGHLSGALIANSFKGATEFGYRPFTGPASILINDLTVTKKVEGYNPDPNVGFNPDPNQLFTFKITLSDKTINGRYGDMVFKDGVAEVQVKNTESATAKNLPINITYTVEELNPPTYYEVTVVKDEREGDITIQHGAKVTVVNTYISGDLAITKSVVGTDNTQSQTFTFNIELSDSSISGNFGDMKFVDGKATVELGDGDRKVATGLPAGVIYTVVETGEEGYVSTPTSATGTIEKGKTATADFVNTYTTTTQTSGSLTVAKALTGDVPNPAPEFTFTITLVDPETGLTASSVDGLYGEMVFDKGVATVQVAAGSSKVATDLPAGLTYTVSETVPADYEQKVTVGTTGTIPAGGNATASFVNAKIEEEEKDDATGSLTVAKALLGDIPNPAPVFTFTVKLIDPETGLTATSVDGLYGEMTFDKGIATVQVTAGSSKVAAGLPAVLTYTVSEAVPADYEQKVTVGTTGTIPADGNATASFVNAKKQDDDQDQDQNQGDTETETATGALKLTKTVNGDANDKAKKFSFTIKLGDQSVNDTFDGVKFTSGIATITLSHGESKTISGLPAGVTYQVTEDDAADYVVTSTGAAGTITKDATASAAFVNTRKAVEEAATGDLTVTKQVSGNAGDKTKAFSFTVMLSDTSINGTYGGMTFSNGVATFTLKHGESKTASGLPAGIRYSVAEASANQDGYTTTSTGERGTITANSAANAIFINAKDAISEDMPQTGDNSQIGLWLTLMLAAIVGMFLAGKKAKR